MKKFIFILFSALLLIACGNDNTSENNTETIENIVQLTDAQLKNTSIEIGQLEKKAISSILKVNGIIDVPPQNMVSISVPLGGFLKSTKLLPGMHLSKGEIIAIMEDQQYIQLQQDFLTTAANLKYAENEFVRQKDLNESKASSDKTFQQAEANYKSLKVSLKALGEKLKLIGLNPDNLTENNLSRSVSIVSPIDGYVSAVNVNIGKYVNPTDVLFELVNPEDIHLALTIYEKDLDKIFLGQNLITYTNNKPDTKYPCEIILIGKNLSPERSVEVHCHFDKYDKTLIPGMFMNAEIGVKTTEALVLPDDAIVRFENKNYVFVAKNKNLFEMKEVEIGVSENGLTQIISNSLNVSTTVVIKDAYTLLMKIKNTSEE